MVAVLPDQVPTAQRGLVSGVLGVCLPIAAVSGTFLVQLFTGDQLAMFLTPCAIGGFFILIFAATLKDRRLARADKPTRSLREFATVAAFMSSHASPGVLAQRLAGAHAPQPPAHPRARSARRSRSAPARHQRDPECFARSRGRPGRGRCALACE